MPTVTEGKERRIAERCTLDAEEAGIRIRAARDAIDGPTEVRCRGCTGSAAVTNEKVDVVGIRGIAVTRQTLGIVLAAPGKNQVRVQIEVLLAMLDLDCMERTDVPLERGDLLGDRPGQIVGMNPRNRRMPE